MMNIVAHNLLAMNANRQFGITNKKKAKSTEKLSSGYKINRAADDAAGLSISEKMRRQIRGLNKAEENIQDGISLCQVADGALNETHDILQRMNELAVKAGNDTNSQADRAFIQTEINALTNEITRIACQTTFNDEIYPLLGESSVTNVGGYPDGGVASSSDVGSLAESDYPGANLQIVNASTISNYSSYIDGDGKTHYQLGSGTFKIEELTNCVFDVLGNTCIEDTSLKNVTINCGTGTVLSVKNVKIDNSDNIAYDINDSKTEIGAALHFSGKNNKLNCYGDNAFHAGADNYSVSYDPYVGCNYYKNKAGIEIETSSQLEINGTNTSSLYLKGNMTDTHTGGNAHNEGAYGIGGNGDLVINGGKIKADANGGGGIQAGTLVLNKGLVNINGGEEDTSLVHASAYIEINGGTLNAEGGGYLTDVICIENGGIININGGRINAHQPNTMAPSAAIGSAGSATININGGVVKAITESQWKSGIDFGSGGYSSDGEMKISGGIVTIMSVDSIPAIGHSAKNMAFYVDGQPTDPTGKNDGNGHNVFTYPASSGGNTGNVNTGTGIDTGMGTNVGMYKHGKLWIHTATEPGVGMFIDLVNATAKGIGVDKLDVSSMENAGNAINAIKGAIEKVSGYRNVFGSQQNRLEHAMRVNANIAENTTDAESRIRDTDVAEEMLAFSNENILAQAGSSMLSQANQSQQNILSLLS